MFNCDRTLTRTELLLDPLLLPVLQRDLLLAQVIPLQKPAHAFLALLRIKLIITLLHTVSDRRQQVRQSTAVLKPNSTISVSLLKSR